MIRASRYVYAVTAWAFVVGLLVQVFLIGLAILGNSAPSLASHRDFGWILHLFPLLILLFAALSRAGRRHWLWALLLAVIVFVVPIFAILRESSPVAAALHPVAAFLAFPVALVVAYNSVLAVRMRDEPAQGTRQSAL